MVQNAVSNSVEKNSTAVDNESPFSSYRLWFLTIFPIRFVVDLPSVSVLV